MNTGKMPATSQMRSATGRPPGSRKPNSAIETKYSSCGEHSAVATCRPSSVATSPRRQASIESAVICPVRGFSSLGTFSMVMVKRAASASTRIVWMLRLMVGSAQISTRVRTGPMPASASAAATLTLAGKPAAASNALPSNTRCGAVMPLTSMPCCTR